MHYSCKEWSGIVVILGGIIFHLITCFSVSNNIQLGYLYWSVFESTSQPTVSRTLTCSDRFWPVLPYSWRPIWSFSVRAYQWYIIQGVEVAVYRRMELKWTLVDHGRTDLESYWLTNSSSSSQIDSYLEKTIRAISPARLQSDNINSYKYSIKF